MFCSLFACQWHNSPFFNVTVQKIIKYGVCTQIFAIELHLSSRENKYIRKYFYLKKAAPNLFDMKLIFKNISNSKR